MDEREFELLNIIGAELGSSQRDLSEQMDMSLGMTNMLIRRLITKGYLRIKQLDKKKVQYILTPKGFAEKMQKSVKYTLKTINSIGLVKRRLESVVSDACKAGHRKFYILGGSDLSGLLETVLKETCKSGYEVVHAAEIRPAMSDGLVLVCQEHSLQGIAGVKAVNLIEELAKDEGVAYAR